MPSMKTRLSIPTLRVDQLVRPRTSPETDTAIVTYDLEETGILGDDPADVPLLDTFSDTELLPVQIVEEDDGGEDGGDDGHGHDGDQEEARDMQYDRADLEEAAIQPLPVAGEPLTPGHYPTFDVAPAENELTREDPAEPIEPLAPIAMVESLVLHLMSEHGVSFGLHLSEQQAELEHHRLHEAAAATGGCAHAPHDLSFRPEAVMEAAMRHAEHLHESDMLSRRDEFAGYGIIVEGTGEIG